MVDGKRVKRVESEPEKAGVGGSIPSLATIVMSLAQRAGSGFRLAVPGRRERGLTPPERLKFDSVPGHHSSKGLKRYRRFSSTQDNH
ncbi:MAG: hypothetical protein LAP21_24215 [Acidobacteriia bacterium]|nr:hypothetical protein [Terriglobia bacterium]